MVKGNRKIYIGSRQYGIIKESEWNFHFGKNHDMRPYVSDSKYVMSGRETGHFGSGTYFSTYKNIDGMSEYGDGSSNLNPNFIQIKDNVYRVDLDLYKNLYRVHSKRQGDILYTMLSNLNHMANRITHGGYFSAKYAYYDNADLYQKIKANADGLGLKCPSYYELTRMVQRWGQDKNDVRSFSTVFMELNGFNGVNVSGIDYYDNTTHGSVIYDLSKVGTEMEEVSPKSLFVGYKDSPYNDTIVHNGFKDDRIESLKGESTLWVYNLGKMPLSDATRLLKNYTDSGNILSPFYFDELGDDIVKRYLRLLFVKNPKDDWGGRLCDNIVSGSESRRWSEVIDRLKAYYWVNYESKNGSVLINLLRNFVFSLDWNLTFEQENAEKQRYLDMLTSYMERDMTKREKEYIKEDYLDNEENENND